MEMNYGGDSSQIAGFGFDPDTGILRVKFKSGGTYDYSGVDPEDYAAFAGAESKGRALNSIKAKYEAAKVDQAEADSEGGEV